MEKQVGYDHANRELGLVGIRPYPVYPARTVYLAGPITGLSYGEARHGWREEFAALLPPHIHPLSPMRAKDFLKDETNLQGVTAGYAEYENPMARPKGIVTRDSNDLRMADAVVACFLGAKAVSVGTVWEIGAAKTIGKPIVLVMEKDSTPVNPHNHAFVTESAGYWVEDLETAAWVVKHLLSPGV